MANKCDSLATELSDKLKGLTPRQNPASRTMEAALVMARATYKKRSIDSLLDRLVALDRQLRQAINGALQQ